MEIPWLTRHRAVVFAAAVGGPLGWCMIAAQFRGSLTAAANVLVLVVLVVAVAATGDRSAGITAALSGATWFDFFLTAPFGRFIIDDPNDAEVALLLVVVGIAVTELALWGRRQQANASRRAGYLDAVLTTSKIIVGEFSPTGLSDQVAAHIADLLDIDSCRFVPSRSWPSQSPVLGLDGEVWTRGARVNVDRDGLPSLEQTILIAQHHSLIHGYFTITSATRIMCPSLEERRVAALLANQMGAAYATQKPGHHPS